MIPHADLEGSSRAQGWGLCGETPPATLYQGRKKNQGAQTDYACKELCVEMVHGFSVGAVQCHDPQLDLQVALLLQVPNDLSDAVLDRRLVGIDVDLRVGRRLVGSRDTREL